MKLDCDRRQREQRQPAGYQMMQKEATVENDSTITLMETLTFLSMLRLAE